MIMRVVLSVILKSPFEVLNSCQKFKIILYLSGNVGTPIIIMVEGLSCSFNKIWNKLHTKTNVRILLQPCIQHGLVQL